MSQWFRACFAALPVIVLVSPAFASTDAVIEGIVEDAIARPLAGATVVLHDSSGKTVGTSSPAPTASSRFRTSRSATTRSRRPRPASSAITSTSSSARRQVAHVELTLVDERGGHHDPRGLVGAAAAEGDRQRRKPSRARQLQELPGADDRPITDVVATQPGVRRRRARQRLRARQPRATSSTRSTASRCPTRSAACSPRRSRCGSIQGLEIYTGGMPAEFGDRLGAVVNLHTRQAGDHPEGAAAGPLRLVQHRRARRRPTRRSSAIAAACSSAAATRTRSARSIRRRSIRSCTTPARAAACSRASTARRATLQSLRAVRDLRAQPLRDPDRSERRAARSGEPEPGGRSISSATTSPPFVPHDTNATETEDELFAAVSCTHTFGDRRQAPGRAALQAVARRAVRRRAPRARPDRGSGRDRERRDARRAARRRRRRVLAPERRPPVQGRRRRPTSCTARPTSRRTRATTRSAASISIDDARRDHTDALTSGVYAQDHWTLGDLALDLGIRVDELHVIARGRHHRRLGRRQPARSAHRTRSTRTSSRHAFTGVNWQPPAPLDAANAARALGVIPAGRAGHLRSQARDRSVRRGRHRGARSRASCARRSIAWGRYAYNQLDDTAIGSTSLLSNYNFERGRAAGARGHARAPRRAVADRRSRTARTASRRARASRRRSICSAPTTSPTTRLADARPRADAGPRTAARRCATAASPRHGTRQLRLGSAHRPDQRRARARSRHDGYRRRSYTFAPNGYPVRVGIDIVNVFDEHYAYRIANGFVGSSCGAPRTVFVTLSLPLAAEIKGAKP